MGPLIFLFKPCVRLGSCAGNGMDVRIRGEDRGSRRGSGEGFQGPRFGLKSWVDMVE